MLEQICAGAEVGNKLVVGVGAIVAQVRVTPAGVTQESPPHTFHTTDPGHSEDPPEVYQLIEVAPRVEEIYQYPDGLKYK